MYDYSEEHDKLYHEALYEHFPINRYVQECILGRFRFRVREPTPEDEQMAFTALCNLREFIHMIPVRTDEKAFACSYVGPHCVYLNDLVFCYCSLAAHKYCQACEFLGEYLDDHPFTQTVMRHVLSTLLEEFTKEKEYEYGYGIFGLGQT